MHESMTPTQVHVEVSKSNIQIFQITWIQFLGRASIEARSQVAATTLLAWDTVHTRLPASS